MRFLAFSFAVLLALSLSELEAASPFLRNGSEESDSEPQVKIGSPIGECPLENGYNPVFLADSEDASIFYLCNGNIPVQMSCPYGLIFDINRRTCIHNEVYAPVGECPAVDGPFVTLLPDSEDKKIYYICDRGSPVKRHCPENLVFDPELRVCVFDNAMSSMRVNGKCPEIDGDLPIILPDIVSCSSYYVCFGGKPFPATCPDGLLFNPEKMYCDFSSNVQCPQGENENPEKDVD